MCIRVLLAVVLALMSAGCHPQIRLADALTRCAYDQLAIYEWDSALASFNTALRLDPGSAEAYYGRALLYASILQTGGGTYDLALRDFRRYLELAPQGARAAAAAQAIRQLEAQTEINRP
jgi:regulator of sirC expression with transglutaminase-like and TPR domain